MKVIGWPAFRRPPWVPYWRLLYGHVRRQGVEVGEFSPARLLLQRWDVFHLHIVDGVWNDRRRVAAAGKAEAMLRLLDLAKARRTRLVWTVHNLHSHEYRHPEREERFWRRFVPGLDGVIHMSEQGRAEAESRFPELRAIGSFVIPQGHYRSVYPAARDRSDARHVLGLPADARTILFMGRIRPYKNVPSLVRSFRELTDPDLRLVIAGVAESAVLADEIAAAAAADPRILLRIGFVPDEDLPTYFGAADVVALPFLEILNSASAMLALSFDRPVLVPAQGALLELQRDVGASWVRTYEGEITGERLAESLAWANAGGRAARAPLDAFEWGQIAARTVEAYRAVLAS